MQYGFTYHPHMTYTEDRAAGEKPRSHTGKETEMTIYTTKQDYIAQVIAPALGDYAAEHNIDAIADEMLNWHNDIGQPGNNGLMEDETKDFWAVVEAHAA